MLLPIDVYHRVQEKPGQGGHGGQMQAISEKVTHTKKSRKSAMDPELVEGAPSNVMAPEVKKRARTKKVSKTNGRAPADIQPTRSQTKRVQSSMMSSVIKHPLFQTSSFHH
jgi:hypothetical protein